MYKEAHMGIDTTIWRDLLQLIIVQGSSIPNIMKICQSERVFGHNLLKKIEIKTSLEGNHTICKHIDIVGR